MAGNRFAAAMAIVLFAREAHAQVLYDWIDSGGGSYHTAANWFPGAGAPPGPNDGAAFGLPAAYTVSFFSQPFSHILVKVSDIYVVNGDVTFDLSNGNIFASVEALAVEITGSGSAPRLTIQDGPMVSNTLLVSNGGQLFEGETANSSVQGNHITVSGAGSVLNKVNGLYLPMAFGPGAGSSTLDITDGGQVSNGECWLGHNESDGTAIVSGAGSTWTNNGALLIGFNLGAGTLMIESGGQVSSATSQIGSDSGNGSVIVTGAGSTWTNGDRLLIGYSGTGTLTIEDGGSVSNGSITTVGPRGTVTVIGAGSTWTSGGTLYVGRILDITDGGRVFSASGRVAAPAFYQRSRVTVDGLGSTWAVAGDLSVGSYEPDPIDLDMLVVSGSGVVSVAGQLTVEVGGAVAGNGTLLATVVENRGVVSPDSPGTLAIDGSYSQRATGKLQIQLGGTSPATDYTQLHVSGVVELNGSLIVNKSDLFEPAAGDAFDILDWGSLSGAFSTISLPTLATGLSWDTSQLYSSGVISVFGPSMLGVDFDKDGDVDRDDLLQWQGDFGQNGLSDADEDGDSDGVDLLVWQQHVSGAAGAAATIPGPAAGALTLQCALGLLVYRTRRTPC